MSISLCLCVCLYVRISPERHAIFTKFFVYVACVHGSVLRHVDDRPHRPFPGRGDRSPQCGQSVIYDCLVDFAFCTSRFCFRIGNRFMVNDCVSHDYLWLPYVTGQTIYIFILSFVLSFFFLA